MRPRFGIGAAWSIKVHPKEAGDLIRVRAFGLSKDIRQDAATSMADGRATQHLNVSAKNAMILKTSAVARSL